MDDSNLVFRLPSADDGARKAEIVEWFVTVGSRIELGQTLCTVETDKSMVDLTAPFSGWVTALGAEAGEMVEVGAMVVAATDQPPTATDQAPTEEPTPPTEEPTSEPPGDTSPLVRRLAEEFGVDLAMLTGTGPDGRITRADVQRAAFGTVIGEPEASATPPSSTTPTPTANPDPVPPTTADLMITSPTADPVISLDVGPSAPPADIDLATGHTLTLYRDVEVEQLLRAHERLNATIDGGLPLEALLMRLALPVLVEHPRMNARIDDGHQIQPADHYDMAFTSVSERGMTVPVVRQVNDRSLRALGRAVDDLARRAVQGHLRAVETGRQTFTVHNLGRLGITAGTTSLPAGTAALVSYGRPRPTVRLVAGTPREVPVMTVGVTVDHRVIDDGEAARFLGKIGLYLEEPILAFTD